MVPIVPESPPSREGAERAKTWRVRFEPPVTFRSLLHYGPPLLGYGVAFLLICATAWFRPDLRAGLAHAPFFFFYPSIALVSFLCGGGPGLAAVAVAGLFGRLLLTTPPTFDNWAALAVLGPVSAIGFAHLRQIHQQQLAAARELVRFKFISDHANDWILLLHESGQIRYANLRTCADLGWTEGELVGRPIESLVPEAQRASLRILLENALAGSPKPIEVPFERRDKAMVLVELGFTTVRTKEDRVIYAAARDVRDRKQISERMQEVRHWESLGVLAGGLAHDFNNLLTTIMGYASLAKESVPADHESLLLLDSIISAGEKSADLVRMMLATSGYQSRNREQLQVDQLLDWMLANRPLPPGIRVCRDVQSTSFQCDRRSLDTLLWSLISNAAESYGTAGGVVRVTIRYGIAESRDDASFEEGEAGPGECLGIVIEDSGCGIEPHVLERIFDPFFSTKFTGRGLGLPAVRGIVRAHSGKLSLQTKAGQGTRVEVWLPPTIRSDV
jgi:PAS domain S-box-containing protein